MLLDQAEQIAYHGGVFGGDVVLLRRIDGQVVKQRGFMFRQAAAGGRFVRRQVQFPGALSDRAQILGVVVEMERLAARRILETASDNEVADKEVQYLVRFTRSSKRGICREARRPLTESPSEP